jgi:hypothetical protein
VTIEQREIIDFVTLDSFGKFVLTISDPLPWQDVNAHLLALQEKINTYLVFIEGGEMLKRFPVAKERPVLIYVALKYTAPEQADWFFRRAAKAIETAGFRFGFGVLSN